MWPFSTLIRDSAVKAGVSEARDNGWTAFKDLTDPVYAGVSVSEDNAVNLPAVYKCVALNAETISSLPIDVYAKRGDTRVEYTTPSWLQSPNEFQTTAEFIAMTQTSLDLNGNAYWLRISDPTGRLVGLQILAPTAVQPEIRDGKLIYFVSVQGGREAFAANAIVHLRGLTLPGQLVGLSPITCAKQTIGIGLAAEQFGGQFFGTGATLSGLIEVPPGPALSDDATERLRLQFTKRHGGISKSHAVGVLTGGASWKPLSVSPEEAQFLETRRYTAAEIANLYGVPVEFVGDGVKGAAGYVTGVSMRFRMWYLSGLMPRITRIETALSSLLPRPAYVRFNRNALLQMDPSERIAYYQAAQMGEWMSRNEIRALEEMNPLEDGDEPLHSVQWQENQPEPAPAGSVVQEAE